LCHWLKNDYMIGSIKEKLLLIVVGSVLFLGGVFLVQTIYLPFRIGDSRPRFFKVEKGEGLGEVSLNLQQQRLIESKNLFYLYLILKGNHRQIKAGKYLISPSDSIAQIADKLVKGEIAKTEVTIPEGFTVDKIEERLKAKDLINDKEISGLKPKLFQDEFSFLKQIPEDNNLEGYLFPDTYQFYYRSDPSEIAGKMISNFDKKIDSDLRREIKLQDKTIFKIITMASLIEREIRAFGDKKIVSGILWKRIAYGVPLQVDATITYITGKNSTKVPKEDLEIDSPYNTYKNLGLPPGPISNPGLESILAAVYPKDSAFWYYLSTPEGKTKFSKTNKEHNINKYKYLK